MNKHEITLTCIWTARKILALDSPHGEFMVISVMPDFRLVSLKLFWWNWGRGMSCPVASRVVKCTYVEDSVSGNHTWGSIPEVTQPVSVFYTSLCAVGSAGCMRNVMSWRADFIICGCGYISFMKPHWCFFIVVTILKDFNYSQLQFLFP